MSWTSPTGGKVMKGSGFSRMLSVVVGGCGALLWVGVADGDWWMVRSATILSSENHRLVFSRRMDGPIYVSFQFVRAIEGAHTVRLPVYRVDDNERHDLELIDNVEVKENKWVKWIVFDGKGKPNEDILDFKDGQEVVFQYYMPDGTINEVTFLLNGAKQAVSEFLSPGIYK
jgi:hypothetical protein